MMRSPGRRELGKDTTGKRRGQHTNFGGAVHFEDIDAFGDGGAGVVDDIEHGLGGSISLLWRRGRERRTGVHTFSWIMVAAWVWLATTTFSRLLKLLHDLWYTLGTKFMFRSPMLACMRLSAVRETGLS
jgi:hypothetical protein